MKPAGLYCFFCGNAGVSRTAALDKLDIFFRYLGCNPCTQIAVRDKQDIWIFQVSYNL